MNNTGILPDEKVLIEYGTKLSVIDNNTEASINNYLKTPAEIDAEFALQINVNRTMIEQSSVVLDVQESIVRKSDHPVNPASFYHGFMEENY